MSKRSVRGRLKGWPAPAALFLSSLKSLFARRRRISLLSLGLRCQILEVQGLKNS
jgi:hypothetical protein